MANKKIKNKPFKNKKLYSKKGASEDEEVVLTKKETEKREEKQMKWVFVIICIVFLSILIPFTIIQLSKTFNYANVKWQIQKDGDRLTGVKWYVTNFEKYTSGGTSYGDHTTYLRIDPRKNDVSFEINELEFRKNLIFSLDQDIWESENQALGTMTLGNIMNLFPFVEEKSVSTTNSSYAKENELSWNTCNNKLKDSTFIEIKIGTENRIYETEEDCYVLEMENAENYLMVTEKFATEIIRQFKA
jgi:ABC-type sugar transport system permease subunit